jgi:hypothetical protein
VATKKKGMSNASVQQLIAAMEQHGISNSEDLAKRLQNNETLKRSQIKALKELQKQENIAYQERVKQLQRLQKLAAPTEAEKKHIENLRTQNAQYRANSDAIDDVTRKNVSFTESLKENSSAARSASNTLERLTSVTGLLGAAIDGVVSLYDRWFGIQRLLNQSIGQMSRTLGSSANQLANQQQMLQGLRDTFSELDGTVDGIASSANFLQQTLSALRSDEIGEDLALQFIAVQRGLGMSAEESTRLFRLVDAGLLENVNSVGDFALELQDFSEGIGANASTISSDFLSASDSLAAFGSGANQIFREAATYANHFGFETARILQSMRRFETFSEGAENVNQLNQMFGTTISSIEMLEMSMENPMEAFEHILNSVRATGISWDQMTNAQRRQLSSSLQLSETEAQRVLQGASLNEIQEEHARTQREEEARNNRELKVRETINDIIMRTSEAFFSFSERMDQVAVVVGEILSPIFKAVHDSTQGIAVSLRDWVRRIADNPRFQEVIRNVANWIRNLPETIERMLPTWDQIEATATRLWNSARALYNTFVNEWLPVIRDEIMPALNSIWNNILRPMINFIAEHPIGTAIAVGLTAALPTIMSALGGIGAIVGVGGGGILAAAIAVGGALAVGFGVAAQNAETLRSRVGNLRDLNDQGLATQDEQQRLRDSRTLALDSIRTSGQSSLTTSVLNSTLGRTFGGAGVAAAEFLGFDASTARQGMRMVETAESNDFRGMAQDAFSAGASLPDVHRTLVQRSLQDPNAALLIRRSFGMTANEEMMIGLWNKLSEMAPVSTTEGAAPTLAPTPVPAPASATVSAPVTEPTIAAGTTVSSAQASIGEVRIVAANVELDGRNVGRAFFEISRGA